MGGFCESNLFYTGPAERPAKRGAQTARTIDAALNVLHAQRMTGRYPMRRLMFGSIRPGRAGGAGPSSRRRPARPSLTHGARNTAAGDAAAASNCGFVDARTMHGNGARNRRILRTELVLHRPRRAARQARAQASRRLIAAKRPCILRGWRRPMARACLRARVNRGPIARHGAASPIQPAADDAGRRRPAPAGPAARGREALRARAEGGAGPFRRAASARAGEGASAARWARPSG